MNNSNCKYITYLIIVQNVFKCNLSSLFFYFPNYSYSCTIDIALFVNIAQIVLRKCLLFNL